MVQQVTNIADINTTYGDIFTNTEIVNGLSKNSYTMCNCFI